MNEIRQGPPLNILPPTPAGLESLYSLCRKIYPDQDNPLQVTALIKYWLGGPDPLDYISMYSNPGDPERNIPPHWHYISFGLSDLHGDGRVHEVNMYSDGLSGFGFELTFRLKREPDEISPPTWPATLMQSLAKYVFRSGNSLCAGDHVSWHCALDNTSESRIQHMLMTNDQQLKSDHRTPFGTVDFIQIVGVCADELKAAQQWNGISVLQMLSKVQSAGGPWLITDMRRGESIFELDPNAYEEVERGFNTDGSNLSGVSSRCSWSELNSFIDETRKTLSNELLLLNNNCNNNLMTSIPHLTPEDTNQIRATLQRGLLNTLGSPLINPLGISHPQLTADSLILDRNHRLEMQADMMKKLGAGTLTTASGTTTSVFESTELLNARKLNGVHLIFNLEAGSLLPLAIRGRVRHGRHFTFKSVLGETAITFVASTVTGTLVDTDHPYVVQGSWLQVLIPNDLALNMAQSFSVLTKPDALVLPKTFSWPDRNLMITIVADKI